MARTNPGATSWPRALARGLFALVVLALLVVGVPLLLLNVGTLPHSVPDVSSWRDVLQFHDDDGTVLMTVMTIVAWLLWLWLTVPVVIETVAVVARRTTPRLPGMATGQRLAAFLLGSIILASPAAAASAATPAAAATAQVLPTQTAGTDSHSAAHATVTKADTGVQARQPGQITLSQDATWWELSEQLLGDGAHFEQLQRLNPGLTPADGVLTAGTTLRVPAGAATPAAQTPAGSPQVHTSAARGSEHEASTSQYRVRSGDNLWDIAHQELGDPTRYPEIVRANPDVIEDPDLIYPGEKLSIPDQTARPAPQPGEHDHGRGQEKPRQGQGDGPAAAHSESPRASEGEGGTPEQEAGPSPSASESHRGQETGTNSPDQSASNDDPGVGIGVPSQTAPPEDPTARAGARTPSAPNASTPAPASESTAAEGHSSAHDAAQDAESGPAVTVMALTAGGFVAAGVLLMLRRKRTLQQRRRRPGRRIAMPGGRAAATECTLRCVDAVEEVAFLDAALRTLAHHCAETERPLPALAAVQLGTEGILVHVATGTDDALAALPPFTATEDNPHVWWCPTDTSDLLDAELRGQMDAPYPALVALGDDTREALLLVDLEQYGAVHLTGATRLPVLRALGTSLAVSPLSSDLEIAVAGEDSAPGLSLIDPRVTPYPTLADAADVVRDHHSRQHSALSGSDSADLSAARAADTVDELWPMVVLADLDSCPDPESAEQLAEVLQQEPRTATAIITSGHAPTEGMETVWVLDTDDDTHPVPGTHLRVRLVAFSEEEYADVVESALTSSSETDVAPETAPWPTPAAFAKAEEPPAAPAAPAVTEPMPEARESGSLLARLADLNDDSPTGGPASADPSGSAPAAEDHGDSTATGGVLPAALPATPEAPSPAGPQADAASPSRIVLPATTPIARVNARLPEPVSPPAPVPADQAPTPVSAGDSPTPPPATTTDAPMVRVLGPIDLTGARGHIDSNRRTVAMELTCWLALRTDGATRHELDEVIAPGGGRVENNTRNGRIREVRRWLGEDDTGNPYYPKLNTQDDRKHRLVGVVSDWHQFQDLTAQAAHRGGDEARALLRRALELVRGRPFTGIPPRRYVWAENLTQDMISAVVDVADDLAARCLATGNAQGALWAAGRGLDTGREREVLWRHRFEALARLGAHDELEAAIQQLTQYLLEADLPMEAETEHTIRRLDAVRR